MSNGNQKADSIILKVFYALILICMVILNVVMWKNFKYDNQDTIFKLKCRILILENKLGGRSVYKPPDEPKLSDCYDLH